MLLLFLLLIGKRVMSDDNDKCVHMNTIQGGLPFAQHIVVYLSLHQAGGTQ